MNFYSLFKEKCKETCLTQGVKNAEMNLQINSKVVGSHRALICGLHRTVFICVSTDKNRSAVPLVSYHLQGWGIVRSDKKHG